MMRSHSSSVWSGGTGSLQRQKGEPRPQRLNINPCALIIKSVPNGDLPPSAKTRLIVDLTRGGVNPRLPPHGVDYGTVELAASRIAEGDFLFVIDMQDAFLNWRVAPASTWDLGFYSPHTRQYGKYDFLPFGLSASPGIHDESTKEVLRVLRLHCGVTLTDFVDDFIGASHSLTDAWACFRRAVHFLLQAGIPVSTKPSGLREPSTTQTWVGWTFDTVACTISVPADKISRLVSSLRAVLQANKEGILRAKQLSSAAGLASHVAEILFQGRSHLSPCWAALNAAHVYSTWQHCPNANPLTPLTAAGVCGLEWWLHALRSPPVRALHSHGGRITDWGPRSLEILQWRELAAAGKILVVETDAAGSGRWGYHLASSSTVFSGTWPADILGQSINFKELWVVLRCLEDQKSSFKGWRILFRVDNSTSVHYINHRTGRLPHLAALAHRIVDAERLAMCHISSLHIAGVNNPIADAASRIPGWVESWANDPFADAVLRRKTYTHIQDTLRRVFTIDAFADISGRCSLAPAWRSPPVSAFELDFSGHTVWSHPPPLLAFAWIKKVLSVTKTNPDVRVAILVPSKSSAPWFKRTYLDHFRRALTWPAGSDLFRWMDVADLTDTRWRKKMRTTEAYMLLCYNL